jgi:polyhydroxyalkanoate synthesis regulator phasin
LADLRIGAEVDVSQLGKLAEGSQQVARDVTAMGSSFGTASEAAANLASKLLASGLTVKEVESALINMGLSARNAATVMATLTEATATLGAETIATTTKVDAFTRQMANSAIRIAASEAGIGQLGFAFGRLGAMSQTLAPILASTFAIFAVVAFVEIVNRAIEAYEKWSHLGEETVHKLDDETLSLQRQGDQLDVVNARLQEQIDKLEHKPVNYMALFLAEARVRADELAKSLEDVLQKTVTILKAGPGLASEFFLGKGDVAAVGKLIEPLERELQLAALRNDHEAARNVLLKEQAILQKALNDEEAKRPRLVSTPFGPAGAGATPDIDAINTYQSALKAIQIELGNQAKIGKTGELEQQLANEKTAADKEKAALKYEELLGKVYEDGVKFAEEGARKELEAIEKRQRMEAEAQRALNEVQKKNAEEVKKDAKEAETAWQHAAETRIRDEEEIFRVSERTAENRMRDIKAQEAFSTAGIGKGPITSVMEAAALQQQGAVAASALQEARAAAAEYQNQLDIVKSAMAEVNINTEEGRKVFEDLTKQAEQLQHALDGAKASGDRWSSTITQIKAQQKALSEGFSWQNLATSMEAAANAGFNSFNSAFTRMLAGGMSFTHVMQTLWTSMVDTFVTSILRMAEEWVVQHLIMLAISKIFGAGAAGSATADIGLKEVDRQASIGTAAATAAISAAWLGPAAAIAAATAVEAALQGITAFERGGIVKANLHEGEAVLPAHLTTFLMTAAGAQGVSGPSSGPMGRNMTNNIHLELHNSGESMTAADVTNAVKRALRQSSYSF